MHQSLNTNSYKKALNRKPLLIFFGDLCQDADGQHFGWVPSERQEKCTLPCSEINLTVSPPLTKPTSSNGILVPTRKEIKRRLTQEFKQEARNDKS